MFKFNYYRNGSIEEVYESSNDWYFKNVSIYKELLKIFDKDIERLTKGILDNYKNLEDLEESFTNFQNTIRSYVRYANIWQTEDNLVFSVGTYDTCGDKVDKTLIIKNNWKDFYFFNKSEIDNASKLERYFVIKEKNTIVKEEHEAIGEFNYQNDNEVNTSIKKMLLKHEFKDEMREDV